MDLYYYHSSHGNFGDDLNTWIWDALLPGWREAWPGTTLVGVGTLINNGLPRGMPKLVVGSGLGYGAVPDAELMAECRFVSVRGPRSAAGLGLAPGKGIIDPAIMLSDFPEFQGLSRVGRPVFVPHEASMHRNDWARLCDVAGVDYVSPGDDARTVIRRLATAPLVIAESMHAAIIADAFGTPWHGVSISHRFNGVKWLDWADSIGIKPRIEPLYPVMERIAQLFPKKGGATVNRQGQIDTTRADETRVIPKGPARGQALPIRLQLRMGFEAWQAPSALRRFLSIPGQLSDRATLEAAKGRYRVVLQSLREELNRAREKW